MDCNIFHKDCKKCQETCPFHATATGLDGKTKTDKITMNEDTAYDIGVNIEMAKSIMADKIYESDASALREQLTNALSHGCVAYHEKFGYTDDVYVDISFDHGERTVTIRDNGMGMSKETFKNVFMYFGNSSVSETENNKRSGMFGLGAISFFRIASSCIVESYHRETGEHYSFMTRGKSVTEILDGNKIMTGGEHDHDKGIIGDYGTSTKIYLKKNVKINDLVQMVKTVGSNYPARTLMHVVNSEGEQSIQTYQQEDHDEEIELPAVHTFEDFVKLQCSNPAKNGKDYQYTKILDNEFVEVFITDLPNVRYGDSVCDAYLCRVPIKLELHNFNEHRFRSFVNIKQEKYKGIDDEGNEALLAIPMNNRDRAEERADEWLDDQLVAEIIPVIQKDNHFTTVQEFRDIPNNWIPARYNHIMADIYDDETKIFINQVASVTVRTRTIEKGLSKAGKGDTSLWEMIQKHSHIFYHQTCHNDSFRSVVSYLESTGVKKFDVCVIGETVFQRKKDEDGTQHMTQFDSLANQGKEYKGMQVHDFTGYDIVDLKEYKKKHTIKAVKPDRGDVAYDSGAKVWLPSQYGFSLSFTQEDLDRREVKTENVYWAGDYITYSDIRNTKLIAESHKLSGSHSEEIGIIVAKKYPKASVPNINELFDEIEEMIESGEVYIWDMDNNKKKLLENEWQIENTDGLNWDQWTTDINDIKIEKENEWLDEHDTEYTYNRFAMFDSEKHVALTTKNSTILRRGLQESGYSYGPNGREYHNPLIIDEAKAKASTGVGIVSECRHRCGIIFCPSKWVRAVELYFKLKHDKTIVTMTEHYHRFKDFKMMPTWTTASDDDWDIYYEEKKFTDLVSSKVAEAYAVYPTVKRMIQWAREGSIEKFENIKWDRDDVYKLASPEEIEDPTNGLEDHDRKRAEEQVRDVLMELHPDKKMMIDVFACGLTADDCIAVNMSGSIHNRSSKEVLEIKNVTKKNWNHHMFIKVSAFEKQGKGHNVENPNLDLDSYIDFQDEKVSLLDDGTVVITTNNHINDILDRDYFYHNKSLYKKYDEWEWR